jgi:S1-C subfamily serine protease
MFKLEALPSPTVLFGASQEMLVKDAIAILSRACGRVMTTLADGTQKHIGTAFFYSDQFCMITCEHVIHGWPNISVSFPYYNLTLNARVFHSDPRVDLAIIVLDTQEPTPHHLPYLRLTPNANAGDLVCVGGFSNDGNLHYTVGFISNSDDPHKIVVSNLSDHGTSGGPCVGRGLTNLIGVVKDDFGVAHHRTLLIPFLDVDNFVRSAPALPQFEIFKL